MISFENIELRKFNLTHLNSDEYISWFNDPEVILQINKIDYLINFNQNNIREYVTKLIESEKDCFFSIFEKNKNELIGTIKLGYINWRDSRCDLGILIGNKNYRGHGFGIKSLFLGCLYAFEYLSLRKITGGCLSTNIPMIKSFLKLGFKNEGKLEKNILYKGEFIDHLLFGLFKNELKNLNEK